VTSTKVTTPGAGANVAELLPSPRDMSAPGECLYPSCVTWCERNRPACAHHWRAVPEALRLALNGAWKAKDLRRWLLACESLRLYWYAIAP
jgi:hypothetical protein